MSWTIRPLRARPTLALVLSWIPDIRSLSCAVFDKGVDSRALASLIDHVGSMFFEFSQCVLAEREKYTCTHTCTRIYMYRYTCVYMCIYIYIYIYSIKIV